METEAAVQQWRSAVLPDVSPGDWNPVNAAGLTEIRRLRGILDAVQAVLVAVLSGRTGRDTRAALVRDQAMSGAEATRAVAVAGVCQRVPGATAALHAATISAEHVRHLARGCDEPWNRCDADHAPAWDDGGLTNVDTMRLLGRTRHHPHRHDTGADITRTGGGTWVLSASDGAGTGRGSASHGHHNRAPDRTRSP